MSAWRVLIVDDEPPARRRLRALLRDVPDFEVAGEAGDGEEALSLLRAEEFDLLLLDVELPGPSGLELARAAGGRNAPATVFVTAHERHAVNAFDLEAVDYLLKPFERERFEAMLARARRELGGERAPAEPPAAATPEDALVLHSGGRTWIVEPREIEWVEAAGNYARVHLASGERLVRATLTELEARLEPHGFLRVHRSLVVNPRAVRAILPGEHGGLSLRLASGAVLPASRSFRSAVRARWPRS